MTNVIMSKLQEKLSKRARINPDDKIVNTLSEYKNLYEKRFAYNLSCIYHEFAVDYKLNKVPLSSVKFNDVDFVGGAWRIQRPVPDNIQMVRGRSFVLGDRLERQEKNEFEFYRAALLFYNCYGYSDNITFDMIVAKYTTDHGTYWSYGETIEQARAFMGIKLYDEYMELIHSVACQQKAK